MSEKPYPTEKHFELLGRCIGQWAIVENQLFAVCRDLLSTDEPLAAIVFYRQGSLGQKLGLLKELFDASSIATPLISSWKRLSKELESLADFRNRIVHDPLSRSRTIRIGAEGKVTTEEPFAIRASRDRRKRPSTKSYPAIQWHTFKATLKK